MILLNSTHSLMRTLLQGQNYRTPKRSVPEEDRRKSTSTGSERTHPFRPERGYEVTGIFDSEASDDDREESPPTRENVPYDPERARRNKLRQRAERREDTPRKEETSKAEESQPCSPYFPMGQTETSREGEEKSFQATERSQYIQEGLQHGFSGSEQSKLQRL